MRLNSLRPHSMINRRRRANINRRSAISAIDPLSVIAGVIAVATAALQSAKALYDAVDRLKDAPYSISQAKGLLS